MDATTWGRTVLLAIAVSAILILAGEMGQALRAASHASGTDSAPREVFRPGIGL